MLAMTHLRARLLAFLTCFALLTGATVAFAQTTVVTVQVRNAAGGPADATVTLTREGAASHSCQTRAGTCRIPGVPPGMYVVSARPTGEGRPPEPRSVPVVAGGEVTISVTLR